MSKKSSEKILEVFKRYQQAAIDFSRRNRLLKYPGNASRIDFELSLAESEAYFGSIEELNRTFDHKKILKQDKDNELEENLLSQKKPVSEEKDFYDTKTNLQGKKLISTLERMRLQSKKSFDEHGLHTLFLSFGEVSWEEPLAGKGSSDALKKKSKKDYTAPLLLIPVSLDNVKDPFKATILSIDTDQQPVQINPVLLLFLKDNFELRLPKIPEDLLTMPYIGITKILEEIKDILKEKKIEASISSKIYLGQFSFAGQQIYEDLFKNQEQIIEHEFVNGVCGGESFHQSSSDLLSVSDEDFNPDDFLNKDEDFTILDADGSQLNAIRKIMSGDHMVIHGPPGTGKSQTIANVIANLLARNKKVLFVCEKQVALEVVYKRLSFKEASVADLCLPLFNYSRDKKSFSADILSSRDRVLQTVRKNKGADLEMKLKLRQKKIDFLKKYGDLLITPVEPLKKSLYWIYGELSKVSDQTRELTLSWKGDTPLDLTFERYQENRIALESLNPLIHLFSEESKWNGVLRKHFSPDFLHRAFELIEDLKVNLSKTNEAFDVSHFQSIQSLKSTIDLLANKENDFFINSNYSKFNSLEADYITKVKEAVSIGKDHQKSYEEAIRANDRFIYSESWKQIDPLDFQVITPSQKLQEILTTKNNSITNTLLTFRKEIDPSLPDFIFDFPVSEFLNKKGVFQIDRYLSGLVSFARSELYELRNILKNLEVLHNQISASQNTIDKYGIRLDQLNPAHLFLLEENFNQKYKTFFRILSKNYRSDRREVNEWCSLHKPQAYLETKEIVFTLATRLKIQDKYNSEWSNILTKFSLPESVKQLPFIKIESDISALISYLESNNLEYLEPYLQKTITDQDLCKLLVGKIPKIEQISSNWKQLNGITSVDIDSISVSQAGDAIDILDTEFLNLKKYLELVRQFLNTGTEVAGTPSDLNLDVENLNKIKSLIEAFKSQKIISYLTDSVEDLLSKKEILESFDSYLDLVVLHLKNLTLQFNKKTPVDLRKFLIGVKDNINEINNLHSELEIILENAEGLFENKDLTAMYCDKSHESLLQSVNSMLSDKLGLETWVEYQKKKHVLEQTNLAWFIKEVAKFKNTEVKLEELYSWSFFNKWLEDYFVDNSTLRDFDKNKYLKVIDEFKQLEEESLEINRLRILSENAHLLQESTIPCEAEKKLKNEAGKKMRHLPIRTLVQRYASHIQLMKPCWMVSPLALGSYLEYGAVDFDVVIFDEASQMKIENSLGAIARADQIVVIGDEHQLPPTAFFGVSLEGDDEEDEDVAEETGFESILTKSISLLNGSDSYLKYHYRSSSEDLIAFSNYHIYENRLITFPDPQGSRGVVFHYVNGFFDGNGGSRTNAEEAQEVAKLCIEHVQSNPEKSLGVIAFSKAQEQAIRDALEEQLKTYQHLTEYLDETSENKDNFFIKNLESVQGDERDVIILSVCYGPDKKLGKVFNRFGPINSAGGYRRLNVAVTRAKDKLICVASMHFSDMSPSPSAHGAVLLQKYLEYAEKGRDVLEANLIADSINVAESDSDFEICVEKALTDIGYTVHRQVGVSKFRIDLAIVNPKNNTDYVLAIECDGAAYHSSKSARIRDRMRQDILERLGWKFYRIWSQHWYLHKEDILEDIVKYVNTLK